MKIGPYETGRVYHGDCLELMKAIPDGAIDAVVTDPPYGVGLAAKRAKQRGGGVKARHGEYSIPDTPEYIAECVLPAITECRRVAHAVAVTPGIRNLWQYPPSEDIGCFFSAAGTGMGRWGFTCSQPILYYGKDPFLAAGKGSRANSCGQTYPNDANEHGHPCAKPIRMMRWLVSRVSFQWHTVLDPFAGSGTTGVACVELGREFLGFEIDPDYCKLANDRISAARKGRGDSKPRAMLLY